ncbi:DNA repair ATPase [Nitrincola nitratireducens]|uniref:ATPase involved in DNA repair n=1 Tax=Nitrincola nitratireducens TaxID=1229521 RepID=W9UUS9_9GAMM|nr:DNA repair ATPase [Nitrincola nitratireducens]EXJ10809.1 ATPase involved in DNA repair [Nitrincola nitratireducens]
MADSPSVSENATYEVIRRRLLTQGGQLKSEVELLNQARLSEFGQTDLSVVHRFRVRTENNCTARDIVQVGEYLLFGYNVFIGLKNTTAVNDVFSLYTHNPEAESFEMTEVPLKDSFLSATAFVNDFTELYTYYKNTRLLQLQVRNNRLLASFQIGERSQDIRVFRWQISADGQTVTYIDNRGERDIQLPPSQDFEWVTVGREQMINGKHPHYSIVDHIFVDTLGGDLTIKVENNTEAGQGIYSEPVTETNQSLNDIDLRYALLGELILLRVLPYRETQVRYFVFNRFNQDIKRIDAIGEACMQLPEDHGLIFPGGCYLVQGGLRYFNNDLEGLVFQRAVRSPNGEDMLYVFYEATHGTVALYPYNLINKALSNPIISHGYALAEDGRLIVFTAEGEPSRTHPMQVWRTPFFSEYFASQQPSSQSFYGRIGNPELVRGISELYSITRLVEQEDASASHYNLLIQAAARLFDSFYWLSAPELESIAQLLKAVSETAELVLDEYEKAKSIKQHAQTTLSDAKEKQQALIANARPDAWETLEPFVDALFALRQQRGHLLTIRELRYMDVASVDEMETQVIETEALITSAIAEFLGEARAFEPYYLQIKSITQAVDQANSSLELQPILTQLEGLSESLDLLSELTTGLTIADANQHTQIIDNISEIYAQSNQLRARARQRAQGFGSDEARAQFAAQFKLFNQSINNALALATTPVQCDEQLSRLLVQLEELEGQFSEYDEFLVDILSKREDIQDSFEAHRQRLADARTQRAQSIFDAGSRILANLARRSSRFKHPDELNTYFASDAMVLKLSSLVQDLRDLDDSVKADDLESRLKMAKEQAVRSLRDQVDLYEDNGTVIKLGPRHRFSINTQEPELTLITRGDALVLHLTGTDYYEAIEDARLNDARQYWQQALESENDHVYRAEFLADSLLQAARTQSEGLDWTSLVSASSQFELLLETVRRFSGARYKEGYERGIHDHDAARILHALIPVREAAGLLSFPSDARSIALLFWWQTQEKPEQRRWPQYARSASQMQRIFNTSKAVDILESDVSQQLSSFVEVHGLPLSQQGIKQGAAFLVALLSHEHIEYVVSKYGDQLVKQLKTSVDDQTWQDFQGALSELKDDLGGQWALVAAWFSALVQHTEELELNAYIPDAVLLMLNHEKEPVSALQVDVSFQVSGLLGEHPRIVNQCMQLRLDDFEARLHGFKHHWLPGYRQYLENRAEVVRQARQSIRLDEFKAQPLSSFVRNKLINEAYLPIIGDNLAKQMGTVGDNRRTDLMGLLMMISPPGYGKTTLVEYVANRLGLIFMKINCPSLGHEVLSLDPEQAPNATARQELNKLNLALEMGNNVMLYLDDIQHTHPEFLQKFISLCDGSRRIEGVWRGRTRTYNMRSKRFCVVMAGNPYTESGEVFKIPDMLANRADIYNLGDILGGMQGAFELSYIENCLTSNPVLAPLATRELSDFYKIEAMSRGEQVANTELQHSYSNAELNEMIAVLKRLRSAQEIILKVNQQYIASAAQADEYRTEPPFRLQGSYRNMNKLAEKVSAVMTDQELQQVIDDLYLGEAQLLTTGAEENLLKLAELRGTLTDEQAKRWRQIKDDYMRNKAMGGPGTDSSQQAVAQLADIASAMKKTNRYILFGIKRTFR